MARITHVVVHTHTESWDTGKLCPEASLTVFGAPPFEPAGDLEKMDAELDEARAVCSRIDALHTSIRESCDEWFREDKVDGAEWLPKEAFKAFLSGDPGPAVKHLRSLGLVHTVGTQIEACELSMSERAEALTVPDKVLRSHLKTIKQGAAAAMFDREGSPEDEDLERIVRRNREDVHINYEPAMDLHAAKRARIDK